MISNELDVLIKICTDKKICPFDYGYSIDVKEECPVCGDLGVIDFTVSKCVVQNV